MQRGATGVVLQIDSDCEVGPEGDDGRVYVCIRKTDRTQVRSLLDDVAVHFVRRQIAPRQEVGALLHSSCIGKTVLHWVVAV